MYQVAIIDDEIWSIVDIKKTIPFEKLGMCCVGEYQDSIAALICMLENPADIIILDIRMPNIDGIEFIRRLYENNIHSTIIIISGFQDFDVAREALKFGVCGYCLKPIDTEEMIKFLMIAKEKLDNKQALRNQPVVEITDTFDNLLQYISWHYNEKMTLNEVASKFYLSTNYCSRLFSKRLNTTFCKHLLAIRISAAKAILERSNCPLKDITPKIGFSDYFYFSRVFKKEVGISPKDYRKNVRLKLNNNGKNV